MDLFDFLTLIGGLCLFLFGMSLMGTALEKRAGSRLKVLLGKLTNKRIFGFLTGLGVTAVIQSSSATTVMVVGFVNSGLMTLRQAVNVIIGANVGTTVTAWLLSLSGINSSNVFIQLLKPSSFSPLLALAGVILYMMCKSSKHKDTGLILLGFATLMFGMDTMSAAVAGLRNDPAFQNVLLMFSNPLFGLLAGLVLTCIIQSSSASVGILQALSTTGQVTFGSALPILIGMDIGTCITAMLASIGTTHNARRAAVAHLLFNIIGGAVWLGLFYLLNAVIGFPFMGDAVTPVDIAIVNSTFKLLSTALLLPMGGVLERLATRLVPDRTGAGGDAVVQLDERLLSTPAIALDRCRRVASDMAEISGRAVENALKTLDHYSDTLADSIRADESTADRYEDMLGTYLVHLSSCPMTDGDSAGAAELLHIIGDLERISDHAVHLLESAEELHGKGISLSSEAQRELHTLTGAVSETLQHTLDAFLHNDLQAAALVEPLEQVVDTLKEQLRSRHILRLQKGSCSIEAGFVWSDLLTNLERIADHCSNIAGCVMEITHASLDLHGHVRELKTGSPEFIRQYQVFARKYALV